MKTFQIGRKGIITLIFFGFSHVGFSQVADSIYLVKNPENILRKIRITNISQDGFNVWQDKFSGHWAGIDLGLNTFLNSDYSGYDREFMKNKTLKSNSVHINLIQKSFGLQSNKNTFGIVTGIGVQFLNYRLDKNTSIHRLENNRIEPQTLYFDQNQKSKFSLIWLTMPLLAEYQIPVDHYRNRFYVSWGLFGGYRISSNTKIVYRIDRKRENLKTPDHFSLHDFRYGLMLRTGYRWLNLYTMYDLNPIFKKGLGPQLYPFTFGITLLSF